MPICVLALALADSHLSLLLIRKVAMLFLVLPRTKLFVRDVNSQLTDLRRQLALELTSGSHVVDLWRWLLLLPEVLVEAWRKALLLLLLAVEGRSL